MGLKNRLTDLALNGLIVLYETYKIFFLYYKKRF